MATIDYTKRPKIDYTKAPAASSAPRTALTRGESINLRTGEIDRD